VIPEYFFLIVFVEQLPFLVVWKDINKIKKQIVDKKVTKKPVFV